MLTGTGTVVAIERFVLSLSGKTGSRYRPIIEYTVSSDTYRFTGCSATTLLNYRVGQSVGIRYRADNPANVCLEHESFSMRPVGLDIPPGSEGQLAGSPLDPLGDDKRTFFKTEGELRKEHGRIARWQKLSVLILLPVALLLFRSAWGERNDDTFAVTAFGVFGALLLYSCCYSLFFSRSARKADRR